MPELTEALQSCPAATPINTGASPTDVDPSVLYYEITTGGTAGEEIINVPLPDLPVDGWANGTLVGRRILLLLKEQTDPGDTVKVTIDGVATNLSAAPTTINDAVSISNVILDFVGASVAVEWRLDVWVLVPGLTDESFENDPEEFGISLQGPTVNTADTLPTPVTITGAAMSHADNVNSAGDVVITGGNFLDGDGSRAGHGRLSGGISNTDASGGSAMVSGGASAHGSGGAVLITAGSNQNDDGEGGSVSITAGNGTIGGNIVLQAGDGSGSDGVIRLILPTVDPAVAGALWNDSGTVMISAG